MFKGYCFFEDGSHTEAVHFDTAEQAVDYVYLQMGLQHEVRIVDEDDFTVIYAIKGEIVFPEVKKEPTSPAAK
jgi:hypothetical protein